jgi:recombinational DNA repair protein (RecF pathway)
MYKANRLMNKILLEHLTWYLESTTLYDNIFQLYFIIIYLDMSNINVS